MTGVMGRSGVNGTIRKMNTFHRNEVLTGSVPLVLHMITVFVY